MANSIKTFTWGAGDSASTQYTLPDHFEAADIRVYVNDVLKVQGTDYSYNTTTINFNAGYLPATDDVITVERNTQNNQRLVDFSDGSILKADTLDKDSNQIFYMAQEAYDQARVTNMASGQFYYSQVDAPTDPVAGTLWYNKSKTPNVLEIYDGSDWYPAAPLKHTTTYSQSDFTDLGGGVAGLQNVNFNSSSEVFLNGVKLVQGEVFADLAADADFYYDTALTPQLVMYELNADDTLDLVTFSGGYSENTQQQIDALTAALPDVEAVLDLNLPVNQPIIEQAAATATEQAAIATQKAGETTDPLNGWFAIDNESIQTTNVGDPLVYSTGNYKIKADDDIELEAEAVKVNGSPLPFIQGVIDLANLTWQGTSGITVAKRFPADPADNRYVLGGIVGLIDPADVYVQATYNYTAEYPNTTCTLAVQPIAYNINVTAIKTDANGNKSNIDYGRVAIQVYKI